MTEIKQIIYNIPKMHRALEKIKGWLLKDEAESLFNYAAQVPITQIIVELGAYEGKSTVCLGFGSLAGEEATIFSIDTFKGSIEHKNNGKDIWTFPAFKANLEKNLLSWKVCYFIKPTKEAIFDIKFPVGLLFIDASHDYESVKTDFDLYSQKVVIDGIIALHDSDWQGVSRLISEIKNLPQFAILKRVDTTTFIRRLK